MATCAGFRCDEGTRLFAGLRCNGDEDCVDGSDERGCTHTTCEDGLLLASWETCP
ncbi:MAG: LDL receptor domain-containing protein [Myxococcales bacterium]|nr:LDL receptor domain-containing protein [Myxococcales bacterium]